jgi:hypothetical protein
MIHIQPSTKEETSLPTVVCEARVAIPELGINIGDRIIVENLGDPRGMILYRELDTATARAVMCHPGVSVVPLTRRSTDRRQRLRASGPSLRLCRQPEPTEPPITP